MKMITAMQRVRAAVGEIVTVVRPDGSVFHMMITNVNETMEPSACGVGRYEATIVAVVTP